MRDDGWEVQRPFPKVAPKIPSTPAKNYSRPEISKVSVLLEADEPAFEPSSVSSDGTALIVANIPSGSLFLPHGSSAVVDCGFTIALPPGYRTRVSSFIPGLILDSVDSKRFKVTVTNVNDETTLKDRDTIGRIWIEPVYFFEWITRF